MTVLCECGDSNTATLSESTATQQLCFHRILNQEQTKVLCAEGDQPDTEWSHVTPTQTGESVNGNSYCCADPTMLTEHKFLINLFCIEHWFLFSFYLQGNQRTLGLLSYLFLNSYHFLKLICSCFLWDSTSYPNYIAFNTMNSLSPSALYLECKQYLVHSQ